MLKIENARLEDGEIHTIWIKGKTIVSLDSEPHHRGSVTTLDAKHCLVLPGFIDGHVHFRYPGGEHKEDWQHGSMAALYGGVTTVCDMPNTDPPMTTFDRLEQKVAGIGRPPLSYLLWAGVTDDTIDQLEDILHHPQVAGVKVYREHSTGNLLLRDLTHFRQACEIAQKVGKPVAVHVGNEAMIEQNRARLGREPELSDHCTIRSPAVEDYGTAEAIEIQRQSGCRMIILHVSSPTSLRMIMEAKAAGATIFAEINPHHLALYDGMRTSFTYGHLKVNPPLRSDVMRTELKKHLADPLAFDQACSDHAPHTIEEKRRNQYDQVPSGLPGVQTLGLIMYRFVQSGQISLSRFIDLTSRSLGKRLGLNKGEVKVGYDADLVIWSNSKKQVRHRDMRSLCRWTPYHAWHIRGAPIITICGGVVHRLD